MNNIKWKNIQQLLFIKQDSLILYKVKLDIPTTSIIKKVNNLTIEIFKYGTEITGYSFKGIGKHNLISEKICAGFYFNKKIKDKFYTILYKNYHFIIYSNSKNYYILEKK